MHKAPRSPKIGKQLIRGKTDLTGMHKTIIFMTQMISPNMALNVSENVAKVLI